MRQGLHQLAQKSINTYFPLKEDNDISFPAVSGNVKSGAIVPMAYLGAGNCANSATGNKVSRINVIFFISFFFC
ncbi:hypothetical protein PBAL39_14309 [Pedobacter sp. BAL39]|nr:hypothetical protein PBAL39_14309 [Pedobacter sp. BAL39]